MMALRSILKQICWRAPLLKLEPESFGVLYYHDKPKDKRKVQRFLEAAEKERREAREKHKPFKPDIVADDLVSMIRQMGNKSSPTVQTDTLLKSETTDHTVPILDLEDSPYKAKQKKCIFCRHDIELDYKNVRLLSQFVSPYSGRIYGSNVTGLCHPMQSRVAKLINRARRLGLMPLLNKDPQFMNDPSLFKTGIFVK